MLLNGSSEFISMSVRKVLRSLRFWDSSCTERLEKLGNSHQAPQKDPLFVYFRLFNTPSIPFFSGFMACFYSFQKYHILGCWNFNVFLWYHFVIILQQHLFPSKNPLDTRSTPL